VGADENDIQILKHIQYFVRFSSLQRFELLGGGQV
jgi:hypothetical protein